MDYPQKNLTRKIIGAFYRVYGELGYGFLEKVYENAMLLELQEAGLACDHQVPLQVLFKGTPVGLYYADIVVEQNVIVELKASAAIAEEHECQLINYLKATGIEVGLLLNFGRSPEVRRKIYTPLMRRSV